MSKTLLLFAPDRLEGRRYFSAAQAQHATARAKAAATAVDTAAIVGRLRWTPDVTCAETACDGRFMQRIPSSVLRES